MSTDEELADELLATISRANRWVNLRARFDLPAAQTRLLSLIQALEPVRITDLATADHSAQPGTTAQVNKLVDAGLVERLTDARDARATPVRTTVEGRALLQRTRASRVEALAPVLAGLTDADRADLIRGLRLLGHLIDVDPQA